MLACVPAREIQKKIDNKQLSATRGQIHIDDLIECYPAIQAEEADMLSLVAKIKETSFITGAAKQHGKITRESMAQEINKLKLSLDYYRERAHKFEDAFLQLRDNLEEIQEKLGKSQRIEGLIHWLDHRLKEIRRND